MTLPALAAAVAAWMTGLGIPTPVVPVSTKLFTDADHGAIAQYWPAEADGGARIVLDSVFWTLPDLLHEEAHAASSMAQASIASPAEQAMEEAAAESVARDLTPAAEEKWPHPRGRGTVIVQLPAYPRQVAWLRAVSSAACAGQAWTRPCPVHWRRVFLQSPDREGLLQAAIVPPALPVAP